MTMQIETLPRRDQSPLLRTIGAYLKGVMLACPVSQDGIGLGKATYTSDTYGHCSAAISPTSRCVYFAGIPCNSPWLPTVITPAAPPRRYEGLLNPDSCLLTIPVLPSTKHIPSSYLNTSLTPESNRSPLL